MLTSPPTPSSSLLRQPVPDNHVETESADFRPRYDSQGHLHIDAFPSCSAKDCPPQFRDVMIVYDTPSKNPLVQLPAPLGYEGLLACLEILEREIDL